MKVQTPELTERRIATAPEHYRSLIEGEARFAVVRGARSVEEVERYLPSNYGVMESFEEDRFGRIGVVVIIGGHDVAGWTLDGYVVPRLGSGLIAAQEIPA